MKKYRCSWIRALNTVKIPIVPKPIYIFNSITSKILTALFLGVINKEIPEFLWED